MQQPQLGDFIKAPLMEQPAKCGSRFRPLTLDDWQEIAAESSSALCAKGEIAVTGRPRSVVASETVVGGSASKNPAVLSVGSVDLKGFGGFHCVCVHVTIFVFAYCWEAMH